MLVLYGKVVVCARVVGVCSYYSSAKCAIHNYESDESSDELGWVGLLRGEAEDYRRRRIFAKQPGRQIAPDLRACSRGCVEDICIKVISLVLNTAYKYCRSQIFTKLLEGGAV